MTEPLIESLRICDRDKTPTLHLAADLFSSTRSTVSVRCEKACHNGLITEDDVAKLMHGIDKRKDDCVSWFAQAAASANPQYLYGMKTEEYLERLQKIAPDGVSHMINKVIPGYYNKVTWKCTEEELLEKQGKAIQEFTQFRNRSISDLCSQNAIRAGQGENCAGFYQAYSFAMPHFAPIGAMLCSQVSSQGASERSHKVTGLQFSKVCD